MAINQFCSHLTHGPIYSALNRRGKAASVLMDARRGTVAAPRPCVIRVGAVEVPAAAGTHPGPRVVPDQSLGESEPLRFDPSMRPSRYSFCGDCFGTTFEAWIIPHIQASWRFSSPLRHRPKMASLPAGN